MDIDLYLDLDRFVKGPLSSGSVKGQMARSDGKDWNPNSETNFARG